MLQVGPTPFKLRIRAGFCVDKRRLGLSLFGTCTVVCVGCSRFNSYTYLDISLYLPIAPKPVFWPQRVACLGGRGVCGLVAGRAHSFVQTKGGQCFVMGSDAHGELGVTQQDGEQMSK